jgi:undecaprenyl diphosphate synthase
VQSTNAAELLAQIRVQGAVPRHVAIIMDGNGRWARLARAARLLAEDAAAGHIEPAAIDETAFAARLYTADCPDPDLLIRTSGEQRISNFLLWQLEYSELFLSPVLWPDFTRAELFGAIRAFQLRERRFGRVSA